MKRASQINRCAGPLATLTLAILAACGGGGGGSSSTPSAASGPTTTVPEKPTAAAPVVDPVVALAGVVADGPLQGAVVCYDLNDNGKCDDTEPKSTPTDANGNYKLELKQSALGKHETIAMVPATAIDKDTGMAVGQALTLRAPAAGAAVNDVFVSALTTAVSDVVKTTGKPLAEAVEQVKTSLGLPTSPLDNFVQNRHTEAALAARALTNVALETTRLAKEANVAPEKLAELVKQATLNGLPQLASALAANPLGSDTKRVEAAVAAVKADGNLSPTTVLALAAVAAAAAPTAVAAPAEPTGPFVSLRRLAYTDASNYSYTAFVGDSSKVDAAGEYTAHEVRKSTVAAADVPFNRNQAYWSGSAWEVCNTQWQVATRVKAATAATPQTSLYCGASKTESQIVTEDISAKTLRDVVAKVRAHPLGDSPGAHTNNQGLPVNWGPKPDVLNASATFPAGAKLSVRSTRADIGGTDRIELASKVGATAAGGKFRYLTALEGLSVYAGDLGASAPISYANTVSVADLELDKQADASLEPFKRYRAAFDFTTQRVRFYACDVRKLDQQPANCLKASDGTTAMADMGDARVLRVTSGYPAELTQRLRSERTWVQRSGTVFRGARDLESVRSDVRLNGPAWEALRTALNIPAHEAPKAPVEAGPFAQLRSFTFSNLSNFNIRLLKGDSSQVNNGQYVVNEERVRWSGGVEVPFVRNQLLWTGTEWFDCPSTGLGVITVQVSSPHTSTYCKSYVDERAQSTVVTLAGRKLSDVANDIRYYGSKDGVFDYANWGGDPALLPSLAQKTFPAGATMEYRGTKRVATPIVINTDTTAQVRLPGVADPTALNLWALAPGLDAVVGKFSGDFAGAVLNGSNTLALANFAQTLVNPQYSTTMDYRVAFDAATARARVYTANRLATTAEPANFVKLLDTTFTVETVGGKRVLRLASLPAQLTERLFQEPLLVEHNGAVSTGFKDHVPASGLVWSIRLNQTAYETVGLALGLIK